MRDGIDIEFREVGMRDGLQNTKGFFPTEAKITWMKAEVASGMPAIEICSFVPPKLIPQFKDAVEVVEATHATDTGDCIISALIPNMKGAERGVELGLKKLNFVASVSETHNLSNVRRKPEESVEDFRRIVEMRDALPEDKKFVIDGGMSTVFAALEGNVDPAAAVKLAQQFVEAGADHHSVRYSWVRQSEAGPRYVQITSIRTRSGHSHDGPLPRHPRPRSRKYGSRIGYRYSQFRRLPRRPWGPPLGTGSIRQHGHGRRSFHGRSDGNAHRHHISTSHAVSARLLPIIYRASR